MKGDIIYVIRKPLGLKSFDNRRNNKSTVLDELLARICYYKHYGIEVEDGYVIHFICDSILEQKNGCIRKASLSDFQKDGVIEIDHTVPYKFNKEQVVQRAYEQLNTSFGGYHIRNNNCEHFASWCVSDVKDSKQALNIKNLRTQLMLYPKLAKNKLLDFIAII
ncbi:lecithin retinol acyltransferase family protein [Serpentinicella sp. ANB-PHB4]|uniref:lecithin retinol acyltransferase family protein n=1 Tax=Serpentinicella sp. ANB-PHB4 TaxID=3074076 RepID=UPI00286556A5|nr:lecithin retinol acyltransferase family protein [Serpentinicella sp. ANB-PHB4]MDR5659051.1 lecithin retinol acyltransferase family protein [Serpentinicella sp. ANB-PHB4]